MAVGILVSGQQGRAEAGCGYIAGAGGLRDAVPAANASLVRDTVPAGKLLRQVVIRSMALTERDSSATPVQVLKGKELERLNSLSVADAVRFFSGVQIKDYGGVGGLKTINVRSLGANHTSVYYDGIELGNAQNGQVDLGKFSLDNIEEIDLYSGQKSTIFQPASGFTSASSLYMTTKQAVFEPGVVSHERFSIRTGSFGLIRPSVLLQQKVSDNTSASVSAELTNSDGKYRFSYGNGVYDTTATRHNGDLTDQRVEATLKGRLKDSSIWSATVYFYNSSRGLPGSIVANNWNSDQRLWDRDFFVQSHWSKSLPNYSVTASVKYASDYSRYLDPDIVTTTGLLNNHYREYQFYATLSQLYTINSWWSVALADDWQYNTLNADLYHFTYPTRNTYLNALATEARWSRLDIQANVLSTIVNDAVRQYESAGSKSELTPSVMASCQLFSGINLRMRGFYKRIFRMPTFNDLYYTFVGNTFLRPEYANQYDLGFMYQATMGDVVLSAQLDGYYNRVTDKIVAMPGANLFRWTMMNIGKVQVKGLGLNLQSAWHASDALTLRLGVVYTYEQSLDKSGGEDENQEIPYSPLHSGSLLAGGDWKDFSFNYSFLYTGSRYNESANIPANYMEPWYTHDLSVSWERKAGKLFSEGWGSKLGVKVTAEVNNLLNQPYDVIYNFPMPGRNYRLTLQLSR